MNHASVLAYLRDPRLAAYATSHEPAWVWSNDGTRVLWANAVAVALFGAPNLTLLRERRFAMNDRPAAHVIRLADTLPQNGTARLERLRGFGTGFFRLLTCACSRFCLSDSASAILIAATERAGPQLSLADRARRLLEGCEEAIAAFGTDGSLLYATPKAAHRMAGATSLIAFEANALAAEALASGSSAGRTLVGPTSLVRVGQQGDAVLIASFGAGLDVAHDKPSAIATVPSPPVAPSVIESPAETGGIERAATTDSPTADNHAETADAATTTPEEVGSPPEAVTPDALVEPAHEVTAKPRDETPAAASPAAHETMPPQADEHPRAHPLRFVWQMDTDERFTLSSEEFIAIIGPGTARVVGKPWHEINAVLELDPEGRVARAVATRDTWSGAVVSWPVEGIEQRLKVELSGLPIYDRQRNFIGYRGFGVCRDLETLAAITAKRRTIPAAVPADAAPSAVPAREAAPVAEPLLASVPAAGETKSEPATPTEGEPAPPTESETDRQTITFIGPAPNVVPFRIATPAESKGAPGLSAGERNAFTEIARQLSARLKNNERPAAPPQEEASAIVALRSTQAPGIEARAPEQTAEHAKTAERACDEEAKPASAAKAAEPAAPSDATAEWLAQGSDARALLDRLPLGVLVYRFDAMLYANRTFLECVGYKSSDAFADAGGIDSLFIETSGSAPGESGSQTLTITTGKGDKVPVEGRLFSVPWNGENALALVLVGPKVQREEPAPQPVAARDDSEQVAKLQALEQELAEAKRLAKSAGNERTELLGKIGKEVRTPLTAIIGFVETMLGERYGPIGNERYRTFLTDIHYSGSRILALFDDLASLSKIDRGKVDPTGPSIKLNEIVQACVAQMQAEASRVRVLIRTSLANSLPGVVAEQDSVRQVVLNLLTNSIRFAGAGGQVIVSTATSSEGKVLLRLRDTGPGLSAGDLAELQSGAKGSPSAEAADQQLTLAVARALLEANHATLSVTSKSDEGTLVEAVFLSAR